MVFPKLRRVMHRFEIQLIIGDGHAIMREKWGVTMKKRLVFISVFCISFLIACNNTSEKGDTSTQEKRDIATEESADNMFDVDTYLNNGDNSTKKAESADNNNASNNKNI